MKVKGNNKSKNRKNVKKTLIERQTVRGRAAHEYNI